MVTISLENMTVLAAHASAALDLLELGVVDESVAQGLSDAEEFCRFLERGQSAGTSEHFSAAGLAAGDYNNLVFSIPGGSELSGQLADIKAKLSELQRQLGERLKKHEAALNEQSIEELRKYFFTIAERLPVYEGVRERLMEDLQKRA